MALSATEFSFTAFGSACNFNEMFLKNVKKVQEDQILTLGQFLNGEKIPTLLERLKSVPNFTPYVLFWTPQKQALGFPLTNFGTWLNQNASKDHFVQSRITSLQIVSGNYLFKNSARMGNIQDLGLLRTYLIKPDITELRNSLTQTINMIDQHIDIQTQNQLEQAAIESCVKAVSEYFQNWRNLGANLVKAEPQ